VLGLLGDALEGGAEVDARADHDGQLGGEVQDVLLVGFPALSSLKRARRLLLDSAAPTVERDRTCMPWLRRSAAAVGGVVGGERARLDLPAGVPDLVAIVGHG
jgi:hypothetical protein